MDMQNVMEQISQAPKLIREADLEILEMQKKISEINKKMSDIRHATAGEVTTEVKDGKKAFSNAELREAETEKRLGEDEEYQALNNSLTQLETSKNEKEIGVQCVKDEFSANRYKIRLYTADKMEKASDNFLCGMQIVSELSNLFNHLGNLGQNKGEDINFDDDVPTDYPY